ncbi:MAG: His-Xaa-Ser system protein HxsD [Planctomycetes bacterium]|nr:His-Xaa-Ser system protein HxsD [Planctomycetota bacterium]
MDSNNIEYMNDGSINLNLDVKLYSRDAILNTTYRFTHKCYINLQKYEEKTALIVFSQKNENNRDIELLVKEFLNELIDQQLRVDINNETKDIRKMIISEAFAPLENINESEK